MTSGGALNLLKLDGAPNSKLLLDITFELTFEGNLKEIKTFEGKLKEINTFESILRKVLRRSKHLKTFEENLKEIKI